MTDKLLTALKIFAVLLFIVAFVMGGWLLYRQISGSGGGGGNGETEAVELDWWVLWEDPEDMQILVDLYQQENPNVKITITEQLVGQYKNKLETQVSDGDPLTGPDIMRIHNTWLPTFENYIAPLPTSVMSDGEYTSRFYETAVTDFRGADGRMYAIPLMFDGLGVYYNKDLLERHGYQIPAETWDDFLEQAQDLTEYNPDGTIKIAGVGMGTGSNIDFSFEIASLLMLQEGATMINATTNRTAFATDSEMRAATALKYYADYTKRYNIWDRTLDRDITKFSEGSLAMMFAPSWRVHDINDALESVGATLDFDIAPVPQQPTLTELEITWADYWAESVSRESEHQEEAWKFLEFITQRDPLKAWYENLSAQEGRAFGEIYPRPDMASEIRNDQYVGAYVKMAPNARTWRMVDREAVAEEFATLLDNLASSGGATSVQNVHSQLQDLSSEIDTIILEG